MKYHLKEQDFNKFESDYIKNGLKQESWKINEVFIDNKQLTASISLPSYYTSENQGFHLSGFTAMEIVSQLMIIYFHIKEGLEHKQREVWLIENKMRCKQNIEDLDSIHVSMDMVAMRKRGDKSYCFANFSITDDRGGLFEITIKGIL